MSFEKKTVYHSALVGEGKISILINSDVTKSKFKKQGRDQYYINFKYDGRDHQYIIENDSIQKKLNGLKGHVVEIEASGSREDADIVFHENVGPASAQTRNARAQQPPAANGAPVAISDAVKATKLMLCQHVNARILAMEAALVTMLEWDTRHQDEQMTEDMFTSLVSNFYVSLDRSGLIAQLPYKIIPPHTAPKPKPEPPRKPEPPPRAPEPDDDEIPF